MRLVVRTLAVLSVISWIVVEGLFARVSAGPDPRTSGPGRAAAPVALPEDWSERILRSSGDAFPGSPRKAMETALPSVRRYAARFGVDPLVVLAVIQVESQFDPNAVSAAGAKGLMQLQDETARDLARSLGLEWTGDDLLFDPDLNVMLGTCYLRQLLDRFGDSDAALAAYCIGPTLVEARRSSAAAIPMAYSDRVWDVLSTLRARTSG